MAAWAVRLASAFLLFSLPSSHSLYTSEIKHEDAPCEGEGAGKDTLQKNPHKERATPDLVAGPWFPMVDDHPFDPHTNRPRVTSAIEILRQVDQAIAESTRQAEENFKQSKERVDKLTQSGQEEINKLSEDLVLISAKHEAYSQIEPTQAQLLGTVKQDLVPTLVHLSELYKINADLRFPFADRLSTFTIDLQRVIRTREETECKLRGYVPPAELRAHLHDFDEMASRLQDKIANEVKVSGEIINPNEKLIADSEAVLKQAEAAINALREKLHELLEAAAGYVEGEKETKQKAKENEQALVDSLNVALEAQQDVLDHFLEVEGEQQQKLRHAAAILTGLLMENKEQHDAHSPVLVPVGDPQYYA